MRRKLILSLTIFTAVILSGTYQKGNLCPEPDFIVLEDFRKYNDNPFPDWSSENDHNKAALIYTIVEENGKKFLRASTLKANYMIQIGKQVNHNNLVGDNKINWDIYAYPCLSWEWRVRILPEDADETVGEKNDSAASIYVVFQKKRIPFAGWHNQPANWIKYVWSSTLPVGTVVTKHLTEFGVSLYEGKYIVIASGKKNLGKWMTFKRNVLADYRKLYGGNPAFNPIVIGIVTDANSTETQAEADYGDIRASRN